MSHDILINPSQFEAEVNEFKGTCDKIAAIKADEIMTVNEKSLLDSVDKMMAMISAFQDNINSYVTLANKDVTEMNGLKNKWVTKDVHLSNEINGK
jgi:hypothetical protein